MSRPIASEMARKVLDTLLERVEQQHRFSVDEARELMASCEMGTMVLERLWQLGQEYLNRGMEAKNLADHLHETRDVFQVATAAFAAARDHIRAAGLPTELVAHGEQRVRERQEELLALLTWLDTPLAALSLPSLPEERGDQDSKGYISLDDLTHRLLSRDEA